MYRIDSQYSQPRALLYPQRNYPFYLPEEDRFEGMRKDFSTLAEMLSPVYLPGEYATLAEQVFGNQARQQRLSLKHLANVLSERVKLHKRHLEDIAHRDMQVQVLLSGERLHPQRAYGRRATSLEGTLVQLDKERRQEELNFWKDTAELRTRMFELAGEYGTLQHRVGLMEEVELGGEEYG